MTTAAHPRVRRDRRLLALDGAFGAVAAAATFLFAEWWAPESSLYNAVLVVASGAAVALHRVRPEIALVAAVPIGFSVPLALLSVLAFNLPAASAAAVAVFGAAAYGGAVARRLAVASSVVVAAVLTVDVLQRVQLMYGGPFPYAIVQGAVWLLLPLAALMPWLLGELVRGTRRRRALADEVTDVSTERDDALTTARIEAEHARVARDVHDIVAHSLTVVVAQADGARYATAGESRAATAALATIAETARDALVDVRVLLTELRHAQDPGPRPGIAEIDPLLDSFRDLGLVVEIRESGSRGGLTEVRQLALYRILQESLTNALRHGAGSAAVILDWGESTVELAVSNPVAASIGEGSELPSRGHGLTGMRERATLAGGELTVNADQEYRVSVRLPLHRTPEPPPSSSSSRREPAGGDS